MSKFYFWEHENKKVIIRNQCSKKDINDKTKEFF